MALSEAEQLRQARANLLAKLVEISVSPRVSYSIEGQSVQHGDYLKLLMESWKAIGDMIVIVEPFEIRSVIE